METKALKRQMGAAIAMVLVAAIALAASTYAWFVSNNQVKATTASVSAQSNSPFLKIDTTKNGILEDSPTAISFNTESKNLYPAQVVNGADNAPLFQSAYASAAGSATMLENSRFDVGDASTAATGEYAYGETFKIGTSDAKAGSFKDLKVASVALSDPGNMSSDDGLKNAISVLVVCGNKWGVYKVSGSGALVDKYADGKTSAARNVTAETNALADTVSAGADKAVTVSIYVFYDGSAEKVYTDNMNNLKNCGITVTFSATPVSPDGKEVTGGNFFERTPASNAVTVNDEADNADGKHEDAEGQGGETPTI